MGMNYIRELSINDAPYMLEWMHDKDIQKSFKKDMQSIGIEEVKNFIINNPLPKLISSGMSVHFAIVNDRNEYMGTVSLKNIDLNNKHAEYAISTRKCAHGTGLAKKSTIALLQKAFTQYGLHSVYLNVLATNVQAIRFYEKFGFSYEGEFKEHLVLNGNYQSLKWFRMLDKDFKEIYRISQ